MTYNHIKKIADFAQSRGLIAFCGAGISINSGLPPALPLKRKILQTLGADEEVLTILNESALPLESILEHISDFSGSIGLARIISMFRSTELSPTSNHKAIALMSKKNLLMSVGTTNFDTLIEKELAALEVKYAVYSNEEEFKEAFFRKNAKSFRVVKLHGCADSSHTRELGATLSRVAAGQLMPTKVDMLTRMFSTGEHSAVLVLGYSCSDGFDIVPIVRSLQQKTKKIFFVEHFLPDDPNLTVKKQRFDDMFSGFDAVWIHADTDFVVANLLGKLDIEVPDSKRLSFDWTQPITLWQKQAGSAISTLILGSLLSDVNQYQKAKQYFERALEQVDRELDRPVEDVFWENYHKAFSKDEELHRLREGDFITTGTEYLGPWVRRVRCLGLIGQAYKNLGDNQSALRYLTEAEELGEQYGYSGAWVDSLGNLFERLGDFTRARSYHERAIREARKYMQEESLVIRQCNLGNVCSALGETDQARTLYVEALAISERIGHVKGKALALFNLATLEANLCRYEYASEFNKQALDIAEKLGNGEIKQECLKRSKDLSIGIAVISKDGNREDTLRKLQNVVAVEPNSPSLLALLGSLRGDLGHYPEALEALNRAIRLNPQEPSYYVARGTVHDHLGRSTEALADYSTVSA